LKQKKKFIFGTLLVRFATKMAINIIYIIDLHILKIKYFLLLAVKKIINNGKLAITVAILVSWHFGKSLANTKGKFRVFLLPFCQFCKCLLGLLKAKKEVISLN
jgi:hypothetical protein